MSDILHVLAYSTLVVFPPTFNQVQNISWTHFALGTPSNPPKKCSGKKQAFLIMFYYMLYIMIFQVFFSLPEK